MPPTSDDAESGFALTAYSEMPRLTRGGSQILRQSVYTRLSDWILVQKSEGSGSFLLSRSFSDGLKAHQGKSGMRNTLPALC